MSGTNVNAMRPRARVGANLAAALLAASALAPTAAASDSGIFLATASLGTSRTSHSSTLLPNGNVLIAGGYNPNPLASAELYDPQAERFTATGSMGIPRYGHNATLLPNGKVLIAGGGGLFATAELYDPETRTFTPTGSMGTTRKSAAATLLPNGKVLIAGGKDSNSYPLASAELYDPATGTFTPTGSMGTARDVLAATLLPNGKVLMAGGYSSYPLASAELYDPETGTFTPTGSMGMTRWLHTATLLPNGKVLIVGGYNSSALASAELYDPVTGSFTATGSMGTARYRHMAMLLPNGKVLIAGGLNSSALASAELYDPATGTFTVTESMGTARSARAAPNATLLSDGDVLITGGNSAANYWLSSAEVYNHRGFNVDGANIRITSTKSWLNQSDTASRVSAVLRGSATYWGIDIAELLGYTLWIKAPDELACGMSGVGGCYTDRVGPYDGYEGTIHVRDNQGPFPTCVEGLAIPHEVGHGALHQLTGNLDGAHTNPLWSTLSDLHAGWRATKPDCL